MTWHVRTELKALAVVVPVLLLALVGLHAATGGPSPRTAVTTAGTGAVGDPAARNPFARHPVHLVVNPRAQRAADRHGGHQRAVLARYAAVPTGVWLTPEASPIGRVGPRVSALVADARAAGETVVLVVYGIPGRDCTGGHSAGGLDVADYRTWVGQIAGAAGRGSAVVLEPDALAAADQCGLAQERVRLLSWAVRRLAATGTPVYLDAGHAGWVAPQRMAALLRQAGVAKARGFSVNVAGYDSVPGELGYARQVVADGGGRHFVVDTGRSGAGSDGQWCNPPKAALGPQPRSFRGRAHLDAYLWVKPPAESDGTCNGGPSAGTWWTKRALQLARNAGW